MAMTWRIIESHRLSNIFLSTITTISRSPFSQSPIISPRIFQRRAFVMSTKLQSSLDLQAYTSGRWLRWDNLEREARRVNFSFEALRDKVLVYCPGATSIKTCEKLEGGYNKVFIFTTDDERRIVAKLPTLIAGPRRLTTNSEVATIHYLQSNTTIPIPKILDWNDDSSNPIGSEYIIMEHAPGIQLHQAWPKMDGTQRIACIKSIAVTMKSMTQLEFPAYGSIYFSDSPVVKETPKVPSSPGFCIGPHCGIRYWDCTIGETRYYHFSKPNRGSWPDLPSYCSGLIDCGLSRVPPADSERETRLPYQGSVIEHVELLRAGRDVLNKLAEDSRIRSTSVPTLLHPDLHKRNIFVSEQDPTAVTGIIDWQSASIEPAFYYADECPDFATPSSDESSEETVNLDNLCAQAFDAFIKGLVPKLEAARALDDDLIRVFRYCHRTWRDGAVAFRHELIELAKRWESLGLPGPCPYSLPPPDIMSVHKKEFQKFEDAHKIRRTVVEFLETTSDGWVPNEAWDETQKSHRLAFEHMMREIKAAQDPDFTVEDLIALWPFDLPDPRKE